MLNYLKKLLSNKKNKEHPEVKEKIKLDKSIDAKINQIKNILVDDDNMRYRSFKVEEWGNLRFCVIFSNSMVKKEAISRQIIEPILEEENYKEINKSNILNFIKEEVITAGDVEASTDIDEIIGSVLYGDTILLIDSIEEVLIINTKGWESRSISEPLSESNVRGSREGFTESIKVNMSLIRRRTLTSELKFKIKEIGRKTKTKVCICYVDDLCNKEILKELNKRLDKIDIDGILETEYIEELISDAKISPFKTIGNTERPDTVVGKLLEGRIAILCDGTPFALTLPYLFIEHFQVSEDYYRNFIYSSINRMIRVIGFFLTTSVPAIYVALVTFHQELIQTKLLLSISAAREGVPLPTIVEALVMLFVFEIIREAGIRLPQPIGQTVSIVGALVLGDAAVNARFVSAPIVIVVAFTGICGFLIPQLLDSLLVIRFLFVVLASILGIYGYLIGVIGLSIHLIGMRSFGIPYMLNINSLEKSSLKDTYIRTSWREMYKRPELIGSDNIIRQTKVDREKDN